ncbi:hypothetical protein KJ359_002046 [Pestalotiopsis sp. 9143b]|nr:hypothetical protein KJ359_002046 [Pestalotiopsis sp. 9143b]
MFLPKVTPEATKKLRHNSGDCFVRAQLKHYGVEFDESEIFGDGHLLMQKVLEEGKCDKVPYDIAELLEELLEEWLEKLTPEELSRPPGGIMKRYFLSNGTPCRTKTTTVVGIPVALVCSRQASQIYEAANKVPGLLYETLSGRKIQTIFMGWNEADVDKAKRLGEDNQAWAAERVKMHTDYLDTLEEDDSRQRSPLGSYLIDCDDIEGTRPAYTDSLTLDIHRTKSPEVFRANFDFGIRKEVMIMSGRATALVDYESRADHEADSKDWEEDRDDNGDGEDEVDYGKGRATGTKRKADATRSRGRPPKKVKPIPAERPFYMMKSRCRELPAGAIYHEPELGCIIFDNESLASFTARATLPGVGGWLEFTGRKVSDLSTSTGLQWKDYSSELAYEGVRYGHWR